MLRSRIPRKHRTHLRHGILYRVPPPDDGGTGSGGGSGGSGGDRNKDKSVSQIVSALVARHGSAETALAVLAGENKNYRARHRADQEALDALRKKGPKEGQVVLTAEQAKDWEAYTALGKPAEVKGKLEKLGDAEAKLKDREFGDLLTTAAQAVGYKSNILQDRVKADGLHVEMREVEVEDGRGGKKKEPRPYVRSAAKAEEPLVALTEYAEKHWAEYMPSLKAAAGTAGSGTNGVIMHQQPHSDKGTSGGGSLLDQAIKRRNQAAGAGNPLAPAKAATNVGAT